MLIDTDTMVSMTEANQNFSKASRMAAEQGKVIIFKKNRPKYMLIDIEYIFCMFFSFRFRRFS